MNETMLKIPNDPFNHLSTESMSLALDGLLETTEQQDFDAYLSACEVCAASGSHGVVSPMSFRSSRLPHPRLASCYGSIRRFNVTRNAASVCGVAGVGRRHVVDLDGPLDWSGLDADRWEDCVYRRAG